MDPLNKNQGHSIPMTLFIGGILKNPFLVSILVLLHLTTPFWILLPLGKTVHAFFPLTTTWILTIFLHGILLKGVLDSGVIL